MSHSVSCLGHQRKVLRAEEPLGMTVPAGLLGREGWAAGLIWKAGRGVCKQVGISVKSPLPPTPIPPPQMQISPGPLPTLLPVEVLGKPVLWLIVTRTSNCHSH